MKDRKLIIAILLLGAGAFSIFRGIAAPPSGKHAARRREAVAAKASPGPLPGIETRIKRRAARTKYSGWRRSPFVPKGSRAGSSFGLSGIVWDKKKPKAMIGDAIVNKGDKTGSYTVVDIKKDSVVLNDGTKDIELKLQE